MLTRRQRAQPERKPKGGGSSVCRRNGRRPGCREQRPLCVAGWGRVMEGRGAGPAQSGSRAGRAGRAGMNYTSGVSGD